MVRDVKVASPERNVLLLEARTEPERVSHCKDAN